MKDLADALAELATVLPARERGNCRLWFMWEDKPRFVSAGTRNERKAAQVKAEKIREWLGSQEKESPPAPSLPVTAHPWKQEVEKFLAEAHKHSEPAYRDGVGQVLRDFGAAAEFPDVSAMSKERFREVWRGFEKGLAAKTQANWLGILGGFARFLVDEYDAKVVTRDFTVSVRRPPRSKFGTRQQIYRTEWFQPIWDELEHWVRPKWEDFWYTGMDVKDLWELQPKVHLLNVESAWKIWKPREKENEIIDQPLSSKIKARWISAWEQAGSEDFMYPEDRRKYANEKSWGNQLRNALHAAQRKLGLPLLDIKTTRHTFTTRHVLRLVRGEKNAPTLDQIRRWLGHAKDSRELERKYLRLLSQPELMD